MAGDFMQQEQREEYIFATYMLDLWRKRLWVIIGTLICMGISAVFVQYIAKEKFRSKAQIMIKEPKRVTDSEPKSLTPVSYEFILLSDDLLLKVRDKFADAVKIDKKFFKFELFKKAFKVESEVIQDTTVKKEFSPVMTICADSGSPENARLLVEIWLDFFLDQYGDILAGQSDFKSRYYAEKKKEITDALSLKEKKFYELRRKLPFKIRQLTAKEIMLAPVSATLDFQDVRRSYYKYRDTNNVEVQMKQPERMTGAKGLEKMLLDIEIELTKVRAEKNESKIASLEAEKKLIETKITQIMGNIDTLQSECSEMEIEFQALARDVSSLRDQYQYVMDLKNQADVEVGGLNYSRKMKTSERTDIIMLGEPTLPEMRIFPKKTSTCLIAGIIGFILSCLALIFDKFIRESRKLVEGTQS
jgi:subunit length determinant Wzz-like protein